MQSLIDSDGRDSTKGLPRKALKVYSKKINAIVGGSEGETLVQPKTKRASQNASKAQDLTSLEQKSLKSKDNSTAVGTSITGAETQNLSPSKAIELRKEKNKESAKNTRKRKKLYIELLENKISELVMELQFIQDQIKLAKINSNTANIMKLIYGMKNLGSGQNDAVNTAKGGLELIKNGSTMQIPERSQLIDSHYNQFVEHCQIPFSRYFLGSAIKGKDFFSPDPKKTGVSDVCKFLKEELELSKSQLEKLKELRPDFIKVGEKFKAHDAEFESIRQEIGAVSSSMDQMVEKLVSYLAFQTIETFYSSLVSLFNSDEKQSEPIGFHVK